MNSNLNSTLLPAKSGTMNPPAEPVFRVGNVPVYGDALLAPMDGFSDWPFRSLCSALGSAMSYTEFVKAQFIVRAFEHMGTRFRYEEAERPVAFQIYGDEAGEIIEAALRIQESKAGYYRH